MLAEARVIAGGGHSQERKEARMRKDSSLRGAQEMDPAGNRKGNLYWKDRGNSRPEDGEDFKYVKSNRVRSIFLYMQE